MAAIAAADIAESKREGGEEEGEVGQMEGEMEDGGRIVITCGRCVPFLPAPPLLLVVFCLRSAWAGCLDN